ncbi:MAG: hypothetical protein NPIRA04_22360 [Nitrospirales bacterium]|nr:MAG: hypothetical protein NPIRA04_22360 [Nitrospirales bacterium]
MDIYDALKNDHQEVKNLFDELEQPPHMNGESRDEIFTKIKTALVSHSEAEEAMFYTQLRQYEGAEKKIELAVNEHTQVSRTLEVLDSIDKKSGTWLNKLMSLSDEVQHHINEEEKEIFEMARHVFSQQQAQEMGKQFQETKIQRKT